MKNFFTSNMFSSWRTFHWNALQKQVLLLISMVVFIPLQAQVELVKDINPIHDPLDQEYKEAVDLNGLLIFISNGELWKTNGTTRGTYMLKRFNSIRSLTTLGSTVFFVADDGSGMELWKTTGVTYSTVRVKDIVPGPVGSDPASLTAAGSTLFFCARKTLINIF